MIKLNGNTNLLNTETLNIEQFHYGKSDLRNILGWIFCFKFPRNSLRFPSEQFFKVQYLNNRIDLW